jgi:hypothetical protein
MHSASQAQKDWNTAVAQAVELQGEEQLGKQMELWASRAAILEGQHCRCQHLQGKRNETREEAEREGLAAFNRQGHADKL